MAFFIYIFFKFGKNLFMLLFCSFSFFLSVIILLCLFIFNKKPNKQHQIISVNLLDKYIGENLKKRKISNNIFKKAFKIDVLNKNNANDKKLEINKENNLTYKKLSKVNIYRKFLKHTSNNKSQIYVELKLREENENLTQVALFIENKINSNTNFYRAIFDETIIETVATSYAHAVLIKDNFNMFESFKTLTSLVKVYKKEAEILNLLVIEKLLEIYLKLTYDIAKIKKEVIKGGKLKKLNSKTISPAIIYGVYMFNPCGMKLLLSSNKNIILVTTALLNELDEIYLKQKIIYRYIRLLFKGIR